jgi:periplasmic protein TonB
MIGRENVASRGTVGAGVLAAHLGLVGLLVTSGVIKTPTLAPSVNVTFLQQEEKQPQRPDFQPPNLEHLHQVLLPPPEVIVALEPTDTVVAARVVEAPPPSTEAASSGTTAVPEMSDVAYLVQPAPRYPPESRRIHEHGLVVLRVLIDEGGHAKAVEIYRSSGHPRLDEAARTAVARAVFKPYMDGGVARASAAIVPIEFTLRASSS